MDFTFLSDEQFRDSLIQDFEEMQKSLKSQSWKAVHVLAGSIIEALLIEYLVVSGHSFNDKDPLKLTLDEAIQACVTAKVLQKSTAALCDVVREYRNLIHPGRMIRLSQSATMEGATIASTLVTLIIKEVSEKRKAAYGPTGEQIVRKLMFDQHVLSVLPQLLQEANCHERMKLVAKLIPEIYKSHEDSDIFQTDVDTLRRLRGAYRQTFQLLSKLEQKEISAKFAKAIREESSEQIETYGEAFFLAEDISLLSPQDAAMVVQYLRNRLEEPKLVVRDGILRMTADLGCFIGEREFDKFADNLIRLVLRQSDISADKVVDFAVQVYDAVPQNKQEIMELRIGAWMKAGKSKKLSEQAMERLGKLEMNWIHIPF